MTVRVADFHFQGPRKVLRRLDDCRAARFVLFVERGHVTHADPCPRARLTLVALCQVDRDLVACDAGEVVATPFLRETEYLNVIPQTGAKIGDPGIGLATSKLVVL